MLGVIGATGQLGKLVVSLFLQESKDFVALVRDVERSKSLLPRDTNIRHLDFAQPNTFDRALKGISKLFLVITEGRNLASFLRSAQESVEFIVFISGLGCERRPHAPLRKAEVLLEQSGIRFCSLRANWFMQNFNGVFANDIKRGTLSLPVDDEQVSFVDTRDIVECAQIILDQQPTALYFELTGPRACSHLEVMSLIAHATGKKKSFVAVSNHEAKTLYSWDDSVIGLFQDMRDGYTCAVSDDLERLLKKPRRTLEDYIMQHKSFW